MKLHMMTDRGLKYDGAVCLDGSDAGFYFAPGKVYTRDVTSEPETPSLPPPSHTHAHTRARAYTHGTHIL